MTVRGQQVIAPAPSGAATGGGARRAFAAGVAGLLAWFGLCRPAAAADTTVAPGASLALSADLVLTGTDSLLAGGAGPACQIDGQMHGISTAAGWTGTIRIVGCNVTRLGTETLAAIDVASGAGATFDVEGTTLDASGQITIGTGADISFLFRGNTITATSVVKVVKESLDQSQPAFYFNGAGGTPQKKFQGNLILRSWVSIQNARNWLIGGATPADGNIVVGTRAGFDVKGSNIVVRGNYASPTGEFKGWNQVAALYASSDDSTMLVEHNVFRGGNWLVRTFSGGDLRYNLLGDPYGVSWVLMGQDARANVHHNIMVRNNKLMETFYHVDGVSVLANSGAPSVAIYNNTLDQSGYCYDVTGRGVAVGDGAFVNSLRNNVFFNLPSDSGTNNTAIIGPGLDANFLPAMKGDPGKAALGYANYNLFDNPKATTIDNYGVSVMGATERVAPTFALNDVPSGGTKDQQVDPKLTGPLPAVFPFSDDDITARRVTVCQILAFYRTLYTPAAGSPLIDAGDPADGAGVDIGAVGAGAADPADLFGTLCAESDRAFATAPTVVTQCPMPIGGSGTGGGGGAAGGGGGGNAGTGAGGTGGATPKTGFACVCSAEGGAAPPPGLLVAAAVLAGGALRRRRRRR